MLLGPTKYSPGDSELRAGRYGDGTIALFTVNWHGEPELTLTVCLEAVGPTPPEGHVWLKGWSENEGVPGAVQRAGIATLTGEKHHLGHDAFAELAKLSAATMAWLEEGDTDGS